MRLIKVKLLAVAGYGGGGADEHAWLRPDEVASVEPLFAFGGDACVLHMRDGRHYHCAGPAGVLAGRLIECGGGKEVKS